MKIISGGQTGVDRAALDAAMKHQVECGGWCPAGRLDEFGRIPEEYPVTELAGGESANRTVRNVFDSDGTVIFHCGEMHGGTEYTLQCCIEQGRPHLLIDAMDTPTSEAARLIGNFVSARGMRVVNVAGPRQSEWPGGYDYALETLDDLFQSNFR